jgi:hypothetical protein
MAAPTPSSLFLRLANTWRLLALRSDVDDIVLELLGRFSLDKIYAGAADRGTAYQHLVIGLLSQLKAIFDLQRLTIPPESTHVGWYLGFLVSWEVGLRCVEFVLQIVVDGRECLWEHRQLRDKHLAEFLLSALRVLALHPKAPTNQRARDRRERFARIHGSLEQMFDSYPGPKSFLLEVCKEVTSQLHADPDALGLPARLRSELPTLASQLVRTRIFRNLSSSPLLSSSHWAVRAHLGQALSAHICFLPSTPSRPVSSLRPYPNLPSPMALATGWSNSLPCATYRSMWLQHPFSTPPTESPVMCAFNPRPPGPGPLS